MRLPIELNSYLYFPINPYYSLLIVFSISTIFCSKSPYSSSKLCVILFLKWSSSSFSKMKSKSNLSLRSVMIWLVDFGVFVALLHVLDLKLMFGLNKLDVWSVVKLSFVYIFTCTSYPNSGQNMIVTDFIWLKIWEWVSYISKNNSSLSCCK